MVNQFLSICISALALASTLPKGDFSRAHLTMGQHSKLHALLPVLEELCKKHFVSVAELEKLTGKTMHPVCGEFREYETDFRRQETLQRVRTCVLCDQELRCVELKVNPAKMISPEDIAAIMGNWTRLGDENERLFASDLVLIYERDWGQIRFDFRTGAKNVLSSVCISAN